MMTNNARVEALARAMCTAAGNDPNVKVFPAIGYACERVQGRADYQKLPPDFVVVPAWELWVGDAEAVVAYISEGWRTLSDSQGFVSYPGQVQHGAKAPLKNIQTKSNAARG